MVSTAVFMTPATANPGITAVASGVPGGRDSLAELNHVAADTTAPTCKTGAGSHISYHNAPAGGLGGLLARRWPLGRGRSHQDTSDAS